MMALLNIQFFKKINKASIRYWIWWGLCLGLFAYGVDRYLEYRNQELDKRLEQLQISK